MLAQRLEALETNYVDSPIDVFFSPTTSDTRRRGGEEAAGALSR